MEHRIYRVTSVEVVGPHALKVRFNDHTEQTIEFRPYVFANGISDCLEKHVHLSQSWKRPQTGLSESEMTVSQTA